jgi:hypothetical protein
MTIISIPENDRKERFIAIAGQTSFPFDFPIYDQTDLQVLRERPGVVSTLTLGTDYTVTGAGNQAGGSITLTTGATAGDILVLLSAMPSGRSAQFVNGGDLPAVSLEAEFNRLAILFQQNARDAQNSLLYPSTDGPMPTLPPIASRAGRFLAFDMLGQPYAAGAPGTALDAVARAGDTMTGPLRITPGSAAAPGLTPAGDANTGLFAPAADEIGISSNGQEVARFNSNGLVGRLVPRTWLDVASAATIDLGAQNADSLRITGTTGITSLGTAPSGTRRRLRFAAVLTITHSAALICPGAANIITAAGDIADVESLGSGNWVLVQYTPAAMWSWQLLEPPRVLSSVAQADFSLNVAYRRYRLTVQDVTVNTSGQNLLMRFSSDGGATFLNAASYQQIGNVTDGSAVNNPFAPGANTSLLLSAGLPAASANAWDGTFEINPGSASLAARVRGLAIGVSSAPAWLHGYYGGAWIGASARMNAVRLFVASGTFSGAVILEGMR